MHRPMEFSTAPWASSWKAQELLEGFDMLQQEYKGIQQEGSENQPPSLLYIWNMFKKFKLCPYKSFGVSSNLMAVAFLWPTWLLIE